MYIIMVIFVKRINGRSVLTGVRIFTFNNIDTCKKFHEKEQ